MKLVLFLSIILLFNSCEHNQSNLNLRRDLNIFAKDDLLRFKDYTIKQNIRCMINFEAPQGIRGMFLGIPEKKEIMRRFDNDVIDNLVTFCKKRNIYYFESVDSSFIIKTNNCYFTCKELKKMDKTYYDNILKSRLGKEMESVKPGLCFLMGDNGHLRDSLSQNYKLYKYNDSVYYFWQLMPPIFTDCENGLIHEN